MSVRPYLVRRGHTFAYRRRVPKDVRAYVGKDWWKVSLKTCAHREAENKATALAVAHDELIAAMRSMPEEARRDALRTKELEVHQKLRAAVERIFESIADGPEGLLRMSGPTQQYLDQVRNQANRFHNDVRQAEHRMLSEARARIASLAPDEQQSIAAQGGLDAVYQTVVRGHEWVASEKSRLLWEAALAHREVTKEQMLGLDLVASGVAENERTLEKLGFQFIDRHERPNDPRIRTAMASWFRDRRQGHVAVKRHSIALRRFIELHGDVPVREITRKMVRTYLSRIENLADHRRLPAKQRGGLADPGDDIPRVAAPTVERHLISTKAFLTFCLEQEWVQFNAATGLRIGKDARPKAAKRRPFTRAELKQLVNRAELEYGEQADMTWLIKLAAYTGARLEELAQLARGNVREIDGIWAIEFDDLEGRHLKNRSSLKLVPLHSAIRDAFLAFVAKKSGKRLFDSFRADKHGRFANKLSGDFARLMDRAGQSDARLVFHSLRHTFKREMCNAHVDPDMRREILGHAPKTAHDYYAGASLCALAEEINKVPALF